MEANKTILTIENLAAGYGRENILIDVNFRLGAGEVLVIIGQNGSGKSTLLKTISGLLEKKGGEVLLNNQPANLQPHQLARLGISFFTQGSLAIPALTVQEHFELAVMKLSGKPRETGYEGIFKEFPALKTLLFQRAGNLSGGERQMLSFAILLLQQTNAWLLDEPTAGLSPAAVEQTAAYLERKNKEGVSMLLVEHNMEVAFRLATHIAIAKGGTLTRKFTRNEFSAANFLDDYLYS